MRGIDECIFCCLFINSIYFKKKEIRDVKEKKRENGNLMGEFKVEDFGFF